MFASAIVCRYHRPNVDIGLEQTANWYRPGDLFEPQRLLGEVELQEAILIWWASVKWPPNYIEAAPRPGPSQPFEETEWGVGWAGYREAQRSRDRGKRRKSKIGFKLHHSSPFAGR